MNLLDLGCQLGPNFLDVTPRRNTCKDSGISVVKLGIPVN